MNVLVSLRRGSRWSATYWYGFLRRYKWYRAIAQKALLPNVSEWHAMLTPFTHPRKPKRRVLIEVLTPEHKLYRGFVGDYHINKDGYLSGILLQDAHRFNREKYQDDRKIEKAGPTETYWRRVPGHALYILAEKIHNLNITYALEGTVSQFAESRLAEMKIPAHVSELDVLPPTKLEAKVDAKAPAPAPKVIPTERTTSFMCPHCIFRGRPIRFSPVGSTPRILRTDEKSYHLFLFHGPVKFPPSRLLDDGFILNFRYALDSKKVFNSPVMVVMREGSFACPVLTSYEEEIPTFRRFR